MAIPPSERRSSGRRVPAIGTSVSRWNSSGTTASLGSEATQHSVSPRSVPSQMGSPSAPSSLAGRPPAGRRNLSPSGTTMSFWSWMMSQLPRSLGGFVPRLAGTNAPRRQSMLNGR